MRNLKNLKAYNKEQKEKFGHETKYIYICNRTFTKRASAAKEKMTGQIQKNKTRG